MKFYRENQVNPLGSCLPLLLQLRFSFRSLYMLRRTSSSTSAGRRAPSRPSADLDHAVRQGRPGLGAVPLHPDLTDKGTGSVLIVLILLYVGHAAGLEPHDDGDRRPMQRRLMLVLPLVFVAFIINFPPA